MNLKSKESFFSVIIPLYNKEKYIQDTLKSVLNQQYQNFEIIIVDDGSTDNSLEQVKNISDYRIRIFSQKNLGPSKARNRGIKESKGDYIALLDADDYWFPNHLTEFQRSIALKAKESVFCNNYKIQFSKENQYQPKFSDLQIKENTIYLVNYFKSSLVNSIVTSSTVCLRKNIFDNIIYDEKIKSGQDTDLWLRLGLKFNIVFNSNVTAIYQKDVVDSLSKSDNADSRFLITQKYLEDEKINASLKKFMDNNRFSILIKYKFKRNRKKIRLLKSQIDFSNLNYKQKTLIYLPFPLLKVLSFLKKYLAEINVVNFSIFR